MGDKGGTCQREGGTTQEVAGHGPHVQPPSLSPSLSERTLRVTAKTDNPPWAPPFPRANLLHFPPACAGDGGRGVEGDLWGAEMLAWSPTNPACPGLKRHRTWPPRSVCLSRSFLSPAAPLSSSLSDNHGAQTPGLSSGHSSVVTGTDAGTPSLSPSRGSRTLHALAGVAKWAERRPAD